MHAFMITEETLDIIATLDPTVTENSEHELVGNYIVFDRQNRARYIVKAEKLSDYFEIESHTQHQIFKVRKR